MTSLSDLGPNESPPLEAFKDEPPVADLLSLPPELVLVLCGFLCSRDAARLYSAFCGSDGVKTRFRRAILDFWRTEFRVLSRETVFGLPQAATAASSETYWTAGILQWHIERCANLTHLDFKSDESLRTIELERWVWSSSDDSGRPLLDAQGEHVLGEGDGQDDDEEQGTTANPSSSSSVSLPITTKNAFWPDVRSQVTPLKWIELLEAVLPRHSSIMQTPATTALANLAEHLRPCVSPSLSLVNAAANLTLPLAYHSIRSMDFSGSLNFSDEALFQLAAWKHFRAILPRLETVAAAECNLTWSTVAKLNAVADAACMMANKKTEFFTTPNTNIVMFPGLDVAWAIPDLFPFHHQNERPPDNQFHVNHSLIRLRLTQAMVREGERLTNTSNALPVPWLLPWTLPETSDLLPTIFEPIKLRRVPRWFSQDWHCASHRSIPQKERHWYRPDGTFNFSRPEQARGMVVDFERSKHGDWWELTTLLSDWETWVDPAIQQWKLGVNIRRIAAGSPRYQRLLEEHAELANNLLANKEHINGDGKRSDKRGKIVVMQSAQGDLLNHTRPCPTVFPDEDTAEIVTGIWLAVEDEDYAE